MKSRNAASVAALCTSLLALGCSESNSPERGESSHAPGAEGLLVVVTERESPEAALQYLHVLENWPENGELDYGSAVEIGEFVSVRALGDAVFVYDPEDSSVRKLVVSPGGQVSVDEKLSFGAYGVTGYDAENIWASTERAYLVDETSGQIIRWDPSTMLIDGSTEIARDALSKEGFPLQLQQGVAVGDTAFTAANWRNWETLEYRDVAAVASFDATSNQPQVQVVEDERCAPSVSLSPFDGGDGYAYLVSDAALGFDALANPNATEKPLCVLRIRPGASDFDPDFFVDLKEATGSPAFYTAHPMKGQKLLVNVWASDVGVQDVATEGDPDWYWASPPYFEYQIVDLAHGTAIPVPDLPRAAVQFSTTLRVDGNNYVQLYREDGGSDLYRVDPNADVTQVLSNGPATDIQYLGRIGR
jgi:hypothetical protein